MENDRPAPATTDGFAAEIKDNQVLLTVYPPVATKSPVSISEVYAFFATRQLPWTNVRVIEQTIEQSTGYPVIIIPDLLAAGKAAQLQLKVSADRMQAIAMVEPAAWGPPLTTQDIARELKMAGIRYGVSPDTINDIVEKQTSGLTWVIAQGQAPVNGEDAYLLYHVNLEKSTLSPAFLPDGRVDFRELDNIVNVEAGQVLAERIAPTYGKPGYTIFHEEIAPKPGREMVWPVGKGVEVLNNQLLATVSGQVVLRRKKVNVLPVYEVMGDVDYSVGNIRFVGNVVVRGSVRDGFSIEADGDVKVAGWVDASSIKCTGSVIVSGGIQGQGRGTIEADGDVYSRFIENCNVVAGGSVIVGEDIMHSQVIAGRSVEVGGRKGLIAGGIVRATDFITCKVLGAALGTPTEVEVGVNPTLFAQYGQLQGALVRMEDELSKLKQGLQGLQKLQQMLGALPPDKHQLYELTRVAYEQRSREIADGRTQLLACEEAIQSIRDSYIKVSDFVHPGVKVSIGKSMFFARDLLGGGVFRLNGPDIQYSRV